MKQSIFLNGVYENVLEEIINAQAYNPGKTFYLQPYSTQQIKQLADNEPNKKNPVSLYISTTTNLDKICYTADIVGWENKQEISDKRFNELDKYIKKYQPDETGLHREANGKICVNLIAITNLKQLPDQYSVTNLIKISNNKPLQARTQAGRWAYVKKLPAWFGISKTFIKENVDAELEEGIRKSESIDDAARKARLFAAPKKPKQIQTISRSFRRNPDVIVEVLKRAKGKCERCKAPAPFLRAKDGSPYLEVHHKKMLADDGEDSVENAVALCPNCHKELHFGQLTNAQKIDSDHSS